VTSRHQWHITNPHFGKLCEGVCRTFKLSKCQKDKWQYEGNCAFLILSSYNKSTAVLTVLTICVLYCQTHYKTNGHISGPSQDVQYYQTGHRRWHTAWEVLKGKTALFWGKWCPFSSCEHCHRSNVVLSQNSKTISFLENTSHLLNFRKWFWDFHSALRENSTSWFMFLRHSNLPPYPFDPVQVLNIMAGVLVLLSIIWW